MTGICGPSVCLTTSLFHSEPSERWTWDTTMFMLSVHSGKSTHISPTFNFLLTNIPILFFPSKGQTTTLAWKSIQILILGTVSSQAERTRSGYVPRSRHTAVDFLHRLSGPRLQRVAGETFPGQHSTGNRVSAVSIFVVTGTTARACVGGARPSGA